MLFVMSLATAAAWAGGYTPGSGAGVRVRCPHPALIQGYQKGCANPTADGGAADMLKNSLLRDEIKSRLLRRCATAGRGFGASPSDRRATNELIDQLSQLSPTESPTDGLDGADRWMGRGYDLRFDAADSREATLAPAVQGRWRLVYTDARDVLSLDSSPVAAVGPIFQEITLPASVTNEITFYPRAPFLLPTLAFMPSGELSTVAKLKVQTRARARGGSRVGLTFESVAFDAQSLLGLDVSTLLPQLSAPLPRLPGAGGADSDESPAYFDILYLDIDTLVIRQNEPGGVFVAVRDDGELGEGNA